MTFNLDILKQELLDYIVSEGFVVFRSQPGDLETPESIYWDTEAHPDYQPFLNVAKSADARIIIFAHREFEAEAIEDALERLAECDLGREEQRSVERNLNELRPFVGATCSIQMAFDLQGRLYVYELVTEWFQTFMDLSELIMTASSPDSEDDGEDTPDGSFGGFYSRN